LASPTTKAQTTKAAVNSTNKPAHQCPTTKAHRPSHDMVERAQLLQRTIGNQSTLRLLARRASAKLASPLPAPFLFTAPPGLGAIHPKLAVGAVNDPLEREADRIADRVMRMPNSELSITTAPLRLSRKCASCEEDEQGQGVLRRKASAARSRLSTPSEPPVIVDQVLHSSGRPLDARTRDFFEPRFGRDFGDVRIHTDRRANASARALNSFAYTVGRNVVFDEGQYSPTSDRGRRLLAHELVHVVQQGSGLPLLIQRSVTECAEKVSNPPDLTLIEGGGQAIHEAIRADFAKKPGAVDIIIPGASAAPLRTEGICGKPSSLIRPQAIGGQAGGGIPDLAMQTAAGILLVAEIKPAVIPCLIDGENQALGYINAGNALDPPQVAWRVSQGISVVSPMLESHYPPPSFSLGVAEVETTWCTPGLLAYTVYRRGRRSPEFVPVPAPQPATEKQRQTLRERLSRVPQWVWAAIGGTAAALIIACFATGFCEVAGIIGLVGEALGAIIIGALRFAGV